MKEFTLVIILLEDISRPNGDIVNNYIPEKEMEIQYLGTGTTTRLPGQK